MIIYKSIIYQLPLKWAIVYTKVASHVNSSVCGSKRLLFWKLNGKDHPPPPETIDSYRDVSCGRDYDDKMWRSMTVCFLKLFVLLYLKCLLSICCRLFRTRHPRQCMRVRLMLQCFQYHKMYIKFFVCKTHWTYKIKKIEFKQKVFKKKYHSVMKRSRNQRLWTT